MKPADSENQQLLRRLSRQVALAVWLSSASLTILLFMLLFPHQAEHISQTSVNIQNWLAPHMAGVLGLAFAVIIVFLAAAFVVSHVSPPAPAKIETIKEQEEY